MALPGVNSVIVPPPSVVVVVEVVVSETWAHANGAAAATAMLSSSFFILLAFFLVCEQAHHAPRKQRWLAALAIIRVSRRSRLTAVSHRKRKTIFRWINGRRFRHRGEFPFSMTPC